MDGTDNTFLRKFPLFYGLTPGDLAVAEEHMYEERLEPGQRLFEEGDKGGYVCFVIEGAMEVLKKNTAGEEVSLAEVHMGQSIGEMSLVDDLARSASVRAIGPSRILVLTKKGFELLESQHPAIAVVMLKHFSRMLSATVRSASEEMADMLSVTTEHTEIRRAS